MTDGPFANRPTAVVTDANSRLGGAVARALALSGFHVVLVAPESGRCATLAAAIDGTAAGVDVTSIDSVRSFTTTLPHVSVLVIAGVEQSLNTRVEADTHDWRWRWETRTLGTLRMVEALRPQLTDAEGLIVTIAVEGPLDGNRIVGIDQSKSSERTLHRLIAAEIDDTPIRLTRIRSARSGGVLGRPDPVVADKTSVTVPSQMPPLTADDVAEVVAFAATRASSAPLLLDEVVIRPRATPPALHVSELPVAEA